MNEYFGRGRGPMSLWTAGSPVDATQAFMSAHPSRFLSGFLKTRISFALGRTFVLEGAPLGDSGVWLITRVRPTIAECEGVANVSGADGSADDSFCGDSCQR